MDETRRAQLQTMRELPAALREIVKGLEARQW